MLVSGVVMLVFEAMTDNVSAIMPERVPLFEQRVTGTLTKCADLYTRRGDQYGDTWQDCNWLKLRAILFTMFGLKPTLAQCRAMGLAAFADMKYWRHLGGYAEDHQLDGINYDAALATEMREIYKEASKQ